MCGAFFFGMVLQTEWGRYMYDPAIERLQEQLRTLGFDPGPVDGYWGVRTKTAVRAFQRSCGLTPDGVVGPLTRAALDRAGSWRGKELNMIDPANLPNVNMERIINHWTAGTYKSTVNDKKHYHFLIDGAGYIHSGDRSIKANVPPLKRGEYAAHTLNCNSRSIGVSVCCMAGAWENPFDPGKYPFMKNQWDILVKLNADLCKFYDIPITRKTVLSHAEVEPTLGIKQRGKWDFTRLPFDDTLKGAIEIGDEFRRQVDLELRK